MTPESQIPVRDTPPDMLAALTNMQSGQSLAEAGGPPSAEEQAKGILDSLKQIMALAVSIATSAPPVADKMKAVRQSAMEASLVVQNMAQSGNGGGTAY